MISDTVQKLAFVILDEGRCKFNAPLGIISRVQAGKYEIAAVSSETGIPHVGDSYPLEAVYCREVVKSKRTVAITEIEGVSGMRLHPLYDAIPCEFYISSPILVGSTVWGTLNYTSLERRDAPFTDDEIRYNEAKAMMLARAIAASLG